MRRTEKMRKEILIAGFGGQGIISAGYIIGKAAALFDKKNAVFTQSYGPEARGGACAAEVIISDESIDYPHVTEADIIALMSQEAYIKYSACAAKNALMLIDSDLVELKKRGHKNVTVLPIQATKIAEELGSKIVANIVMLGFLTKAGKVVSSEAVKKSILDTVPKGTEKLNLNAFEKGYSST